MLPCTGADLGPLPPSAQQAAKYDDAAHTPTDEPQRPEPKGRRDNLADALSALMSMVPDADEREAGDFRGQVFSTCAPAAGTPHNSSSDEEGTSSSEQENPATDVRRSSAGRQSAVPPMGGGSVTQGGSGGETDKDEAPGSPPGPAQTGGAAVGAEAGLSKAAREESLRYLQQLPNGATLAAALAKRLQSGTPAELGTVADPRTRTFTVAPKVSDDAAREARLVALVKYKRKREQQKLHPQVRYKSRKKIADNRVRDHTNSLTHAANIHSLSRSLSVSHPDDLANVSFLACVALQPRVKGRFIKTGHCIKSSGAEDDVAADMADMSMVPACESPALQHSGDGSDDGTDDGGGTDSPQ